MTFFKNIIDKIFNFLKIKKTRKKTKNSLGFTIYNNLEKSKNRNFKDIKKPYRRI